VASLPLCASILPYFLAERQGIGGPERNTPRDVKRAC